MLVDLNKDHQPEALVMEGTSQASLFQREGGGEWRYVGIMNTDSPGYDKTLGIISALESGSIQAIEPAWQVLQIGKNQYYFQPLP